MSGRKYGKELARVSTRKPGAVTTPEQSLSELLPAFEKLFDHYDLKMGDWPLLALRLAVDGGFLRFAKKPSGPTFWTDRQLIKLWASVELARMRNPRLSEKAACEHLELSWAKEGAFVSSSMKRKSWRQLKR